MASSSPWQFKEAITLNSISIPFIQRINLDNDCRPSQIDYDFLNSVIWTNTEILINNKLPVKGEAEIEKQS